MLQLQCIYHIMNTFSETGSVLGGLQALKRRDHFQSTGALLKDQGHEPGVMNP